MLDDDDRHAALAKKANPFEQPIHLGGVEPGGGLIEHEKSWRGRKGACKFKHALLTVGE